MTVEGRAVNKTESKRTEAAGLDMLSNEGVRGKWLRYKGKSFK